MRKLAEIEAAEAADVATFLAKHPEFAEGRFERDHHERRWVGRKNLTTFPIDPDTLNDAELGNALWPRSEPLDDMQKWTRDLVEDAFARMRPRDVEVLRRRYFERMTLDEMAAESGVTRQAIIKQLKTATKHARKELA